MEMLNFLQVGSMNTVNVNKQTYPFFLFSVLILSIGKKVWAKLLIKVYFKALSLLSEVEIYLGCLLNSICNSVPLGKPLSNLGFDKKCNNGLLICSNTILNL